MSTERIYAKVIEIAAGHQARQTCRDHLDIGAGRGELISKFRKRFGAESAACDYTDRLMELPGQKVDIANLNHDPLPYPDERFDVVTATEVIEHLEDFRRVTREIYRVLRPGGYCRGREAHRSAA